MLCHGENRGCCFITYSDTVKELRFLAKLLHSCLTFFEGRAWMPEVERPEFRKDAKPTKRSLKGKGVGGFRGIVRMRNRISTHRRSPYEKDNVIVRTPNHIGTLTLVLRKIIQYNKTHRRDVNSSRRCFCYSLGTIITIPSSCEL